jgi:hypothetical protein
VTDVPANVRAYMWGKMKLAGPGYHINCVLESKAGKQMRGQDSPDDGDALALTFTPVVRKNEILR